MTKSFESRIKELVTSSVKLSWSNQFLATGVTEVLVVIRADVTHR